MCCDSLDVDSGLGLRSLPCTTTINRKRSDCEAEVGVGGWDGELCGVAVGVRGLPGANGPVKSKQAKETKRKAADEGMVSPHLH